jgi:hypothetical protein
MSDDYSQDPAGQGGNSLGAFHVVWMNDDGKWRIIYITRDPELAQRAVALTLAHDPTAQCEVEVMTAIPRPRC